ncbi:MAG: Fic family protein [Candidatus Nanopelagicales bacterium]
MSGDPLGGLLELPGVAEEISQARDAIDAVRADRRVWRERARVAAESRLLGAWASAALEGSAVGLEQLRSGAALDGSPVGRLMAGSVVLSDLAPRLVPLVATSPAQVLAELQVAAGVAVGEARAADLGRPRQGEQAVDALHLGTPPPPQELPSRLNGVSLILRDSRAPGLLVAAIVHAELAWLRPFRVGSGLVARALDRVILAQRGVDPDLLAVPELGLWLAGRAKYADALRGYAKATPADVAAWVGFYARAVGAQAGGAARAIAGSPG